jgi:hypothetical protein
MNRSTSRLVTVLAGMLLCTAAATTASSGVLTPAGFECTQWDLTGHFTLVQTNVSSPSFRLAQTPVGLQGTAFYAYTEDDDCIIVFCGDDYFEVHGSVDGTVVGDEVELVAYWNNGTTGVYSGKVGQQGRMEGNTYDRQHPQVIARWYSQTPVKCLAGTTSTGERIGTTSSALGTAPAPVAVRPQGRVRIGGAAPTPSTLTKCEAAKAARARNSPAAPGLEKQCAAEQASGVSNAATATDAVRRRPRGESPTTTMSEKFGAGGAALLAFAASQPESTIKVRVRYKKAFGYKGDQSAFGYVGPTSCDAFSISVAPVASTRQRDPYRISSDSKMADVGGYYICNYLVSDMPLNQAMAVSVRMSGENASGAWNGGDEPQPPTGQQRTIFDPTRTATLNATQPRARLSFEMIYAPVVSR